LIGLDWGTSACRAYLMRRDGTVLETRAGDEGILAVPADGFDACSPARSPAGTRPTAPCR